MTAADLAAALLRTTLATSAAACLAALLLARLRIHSPRTHRLAWTLVVLQGWALLPWTISLERPAPPPAPPELLQTTDWTQSAGSTEPILMYAATASPPTPAPRPSTFAPTAALVAWLAGALTLALFASARYARIAATLPRGAAPNNPAWQTEWQRELTRARRDHSTNRWRFPARIDFRITQSLGPLVAYIPPAYRILAPHSLWTALTRPQRRAILRHELAHIRRRDLWKSLALRVLALPQWFNPLVWLAVRRFDEAAEWSCDALAARGPARQPTTIAAALVRTAELTASTRPLTTIGFIPAVPAGHPTPLARRIHRLVTPRVKEDSTMQRLLVPALLATIAAAQLIRIDRVAAESPSLSRGGAGGGSAATSTTAENASIVHDNEVITISAEQRATLLADQWDSLAKLPYVIESPDALLVHFTPSEKHPESNRGLLRWGGTRLPCVVQPDGRIEVNVYVNDRGRIATGTIEEARKRLGHDPVHVVDALPVAGLTPEQAAEAISQQLCESANIIDVRVEVSSANSRAAYVIVQHPEGDNVVRIAVPYPLTKKRNVAAALQQSGRRTFKLADAKISLHRPAPNGTSVESEWPIVCDAESGQPVAETDYPLLPGDRIFVKAPRPIRKDAVTVILKGLGPNSVQYVPFSQEMTVSDAIGGAVFPNPIDFSTATIVLTRILDPAPTGQEASWTIRWDAAAGQPAEGEDRTLEPGDYVTIELPPAPAQPPRTPAPIAAAALPASPSEITTADAQISEAPSRAAPPRPVTTAADPGPDAAVTLELHLPQDRTHKQTLSLTGPTKLGDLLASAVYPEPIDFAAATISLSRPFGPRELGGIAEFFIGWDRAAQRPKADSDYGLEAGDRITLDFRKPEPGATILPHPVPPAPQPAPPAETASPTKGQIEFSIAFIGDIDGDFAELAGAEGDSDVAVAIRDAATLEPALRVLERRRHIKRLVEPRIVARLGEPAQFNAAVPIPGRDRVFSPQYQARVLAQTAAEAPASTYKIELAAMAKDGEEKFSIDCGFMLHEGQSGIARLRPETEETEGDEDPASIYVVVTPALTE